MYEIKPVHIKGFPNEYVGKLQYFILVSRRIREFAMLNDIILNFEMYDRLNNCRSFISFSTS